MSARRSISMILVWLFAAAGVLVCSAPALAQRLHEFSGSFGSEGSGDGQFSQPGNIAVNEATGDVYVIDRANRRVEIFSSSGAYVGQFDGSASPTGQFSWPENESTREIVAEGGIAVDNSTNPLDPSKGDLYAVDRGHNVVDKFGPKGEYIGQILGRSPTTPFLDEGYRHVSSVAVDPNGELWVEIGNTETPHTKIEIFNDAVANEYVSEVEGKLRGHGASFGSVAFADVGLALDSEDDFYNALLLSSADGSKIIPGSRFTAEFSKLGESLDEALEDENPTGIAVDLASNDVYVDHKSSVAAYGPSGDLIERFGSPQMQASEGVAVDSATGTVYASSTTGQDIDVFRAFVIPDVSTGSASNFTETSVTVSGVVNPDGLPVGECVFEYGTSTAYGQVAPCSPSPGSGGNPVDVSANLTGLERSAEYHFRVRVANANGVNFGKDRTFRTPAPVVLGEEEVSDIASTSVLFGAQVDPSGSDTTYEFEYGTSKSYGESMPVPAGDVGAVMSSVPVAVRVEGLSPETTYHVRIAAVNVLGTVYGPDLMFTTQSAGGAFSLPDGRVWEMVSPPSKDGANIEPLGATRAAGVRALTEAAVDGSAVSYVASGPVGGNVGGNANPLGLTQVLSRRGAKGWSSEDISPPHKFAGEEEFAPEYQFFSSDLSRGLVELSGEELLSPEATEWTPYLREMSNGSYTPLVSAADVAPGTKFGPTYFEGPRVIAVTPDLSHELIFSGSHLYEWAGGRLQLVYADPASADSLFQRYALSSDGSRVIYEPQGGGVDLRDMVTDQTVEVDPNGVDPSGAELIAANAEGSLVFYGYGDLYVYSTATGTSTDLSPDSNSGESSSLVSMLGASEDGSVVYFLARGKLATGAEPGKDNLYVVSKAGASWSAPRLVAILSAEDSEDWAGDSSSLRVSPNGRYLAFMSDRSLTGYDNRDATSGVPDEEAFIYDDAGGQLKCVSCNPTGARPDGIYDEEAHLPLANRSRLAWTNRWLAANIPVGTEVGNPGAEEGIAYPSRVISDEGRMFFNSFDSLVPQDTNGKADVYEYEPEGVGSCTRAGGCVALISSGTSGEESAFLEASENGDDVFFLTAARLLSQDVDTSFDVYDAHACSQAVPCVREPVTPPPCASGDACKPAPSLQPAIFGAPSSATFSGAGNVTSLTPEVAVKVKPKAKPARCRRGSARRGGRCVRGRAGKKRAGAGKANAKRGVRS